MKPLTAEYVRSFLNYDSKTGIFIWIAPRYGITVGKIAGSSHHSGYRTIRMNGKVYQQHRLAWLYITGKWPDGEIDHINCVRSDNRFANLRVVTKTINLQNRKRSRVDNKSGLLGVGYFAPNNKWRARIQVNGKQIYLGHHATKELAHAAYLEAKRRLHKGNTL